MSTIQQLIDSGEVVPGKTKVLFGAALSKGWFIAHWLAGDEYICQDANNCAFRTHIHEGPIELYTKPVEMEDRWLWADGHGNIFHKLIAKDFTHEGHYYGIKLEWSKTQFQKENK